MNWTANWTGNRAGHGNSTIPTAGPPTGDISKCSCEGLGVLDILSVVCGKLPILINNNNDVQAELSSVDPQLCPPLAR